MRTYTEAKVLADAKVTEIGSFAGGKARRVLFLHDGENATARMYKTEIVTWFRTDGF